MSQCEVSSKRAKDLRAKGSFHELDYTGLECSITAAGMASRKVKTWAFSLLLGCAISAYWPADIYVEPRDTTEYRRKGTGFRCGTNLCPEQLTEWTKLHLLRASTS